VNQWASWEILGPQIQVASVRGKSDPSRVVSTLCTSTNPKPRSKRDIVIVCEVMSLPGVFRRGRSYIHRHPAKEIRSWVCKSKENITLNCSFYGELNIYDWGRSFGPTTQVQKNTVEKCELRYFSCSSICGINSVALFRQLGFDKE
jgi:hypothetical protein